MRTRRSGVAGNGLLPRLQQACRRCLGHRPLRPRRRPAGARRTGRHPVTAGISSEVSASPRTVAALFSVLSRAADDPRSAVEVIRLHAGPTSPVRSPSAPSRIPLSLPLDSRRAATRPVVAKPRMCEGVIGGSVAGLYRQALHRYGPADGELLAIALLEEQAGLRLRHPPAACGPDDPRPLTRVFSFCPAQRGRCGKLPGAWRPAGAR
jgi:hypothetical protein